MSIGLQGRHCASRHLRLNGTFTVLALAALLFISTSRNARAEDDSPAATALSISGELKLDVVGVAAGGLDRGVSHVETLDIAADLDLDEALGVPGLVAHADLLVSLGQAPNERVGGLQGVNNAEVGDRGVRLYQAWFEKTLGDGGSSLRAGFSDLNTEFDVADSAGLLLGAQYGVGPEFAATGPAGPSLYPSTALGVRLRYQPSETRYLIASIANAHAGVPGDEGGPDWSFDDGVLMIAEGGWTGRGKVAAGAWTYSRRQDDIREVDAGGAPISRRAWGGYVVVEQPVATGVTAFFKAGVSDGRTTDFAGGVQAGILFEDGFGLPQGASLSFGASQAVTTGRARRNARDAGLDPAAGESQFEATYFHPLNNHLAVQPDVQVVLRPGGRQDVKTAVVLGLRLVASF